MSTSPAIQHWLHETGNNYERKLQYKVVSQNDGGGSGTSN